MRVQHLLSGEEQGGMRQGKIHRGREGYGKQKRKGWEVGILKEWKVGEIGENCTTMINIL